ncbi:MAG: hypothetical protein AB7G08_03930 [Hyphomicrobiaceae bacterium]
MLEQAPDRARHTLTVTEVEGLLAEAGVPRSDRRIKFFCQTGALAAAKFPTPTGPQWYIDPASVPGLIGDLKQFEEQKRRRLEQAAAGSDTPKEALNDNTDAAGSSRLQHAAAGKDDAEQENPAGGLSQQAASAPTAAYVEQLEKRIEEKDDQIKFLREELIDRRAQISGMKAIIDGQRQLLETINSNVAPVFGALAQLVRGKSETSENIRATVVNDSEEREGEPRVS